MERAVVHAVVNGEIKTDTITAHSVNMFIHDDNSGQFTGTNEEGKVVEILYFRLVDQYNWKKLDAEIKED